MSKRRARQQRTQREIDLPSPLRECVDCAMDKDRAYFETHPDDDWYVRPALVGEWGDFSFRVREPFVLVRRAHPTNAGLRTRQPISARYAHDLQQMKANGVLVFFTDL